MVIEKQIEAFASLGQYLRENRDGDSQWHDLLKKASAKNPFFVPENVEKATSILAEQLRKENLFEWWTSEIGEEIRFREATVAVVMAGNIPWVGFHDVLSVLVSGCNILLKPSSKDFCMWEFLKEKMPESLGKKIELTKDIKRPFDAIVATGSDNTFRYFDYYFRNDPHILRKHRTSCAILTGREAEEELIGIWDDMLLYFGMGCRSVSKLYIPRGFDWQGFIDAGVKNAWSKVMDCKAYSDNYAYRKVVTIMNGVSCMDSEFLLFRESDSNRASVGECLYEYYDNIEQSLEKIKEVGLENWQCVVGSDSLSQYDNQWPLQRIKPGKTQYPSLNDYADGISLPLFLKESFAVL